MKQILVRYINIILGAIVAAFALEEFLVPANILDGGIVGTSIIISSITPISLSILTVCLNLPFVLVGAKQLEKSFLPRTIVAMGVFSLFLEIFNRWHYDATYDALLATVFGGLILGAGVGLIIRNGGCLDGTETVAIMVAKKTSLSVGQIVLVCNIIIYLIAGILFGLDQGKAVMIITDQGRVIAEDIYKTLGRTVTFLSGEGLLSGEKTVLYCVITRMELPLIRKIIEKDDYSAFMTISDVSEIIGHHIKNSESKIYTKL